MHKVSIRYAQVGSVLAEPIVVDGVTICPEGTILSAKLKGDLLKFSVDDVTVHSAVDSCIPEDVVRFKQLDSYMYSSISNLSDEDIVAFADILVTDVLNHEARKQLNVLHDYDLTTYQHSINVACLACVVGIFLNLSITELKTLTLGALLHDVGKQIIPLDILQKHGTLTSMEFDVVKSHAKLGYTYLMSDFLNKPDIIDCVVQHHENHDGSGYPFNLKGDEISKYAQIIHICDVYEALCAERPYKVAMSRDKARELLLRSAGTQFNPEMLKVFLCAVPNYYLGEVLNAYGHTGVVTRVVNGNAVAVYTGDEILTVEDFYAQK